jgi:hypothetical protein
MKIGYNTLDLSEKWVQHLLSKPETGMGYQICTIYLKNGKKYCQAIIDSGCITKIRNIEGIPFSDDDIKEIEVTHEKWI